MTLKAPLPGKGTYYVSEDKDADVFGTLFCLLHQVAALKQLTF